MPTIPPLTTGYTLEEAEQDIADLRGDVDSMDEILTLLDGPIPNGAPISGCQMFSVNGQPNYLNFTGLQMSMQGARPATFPNNTASAASLTSITTFSIPAGDADIGAIYEIDCWGNGTQNNTGATGNRQTLQFATIFGGTTFSSVTFGTTAFEDTLGRAFRFRVQARIICITTGLTGTWVSYIDAKVADLGANIAPGNADFAVAFSCESTTTTAIDTTTGETMGISAAWGGTGGSPSLTSRVAFVKRLC